MCDSLEIWGAMGGAGTPCCKEFHIGVVSGKLYGWGGRVSVSSLILRLGWGVGFGFAMIAGVGSSC